MIAVNPTDPNNLIAVAKDYSLGTAHKCNVTNMWAGAYNTFDGGKSCTDKLLSLTPDEKEDHLWDCTSDPVVAFDSAGTAYFSGLGIALPTSPPTPTDVRGIWVAKSFDCGG